MSLNPNLKDDLVHMDDGFLCFWPTSNKGAFTAQNLRKIADHLDKENELIMRIFNQDSCKYCGKQTTMSDNICADCVPF